MTAGTDDRARERWWARQHGLDAQAKAAGFTGAEVDLIAYGRRQADNAINWQTSCVGCADRLDGLIEERAAGARDALQDVERALKRGTTVEEALASLWEQLGGRAERHGERLGGPLGWTARGPALPGGSGGSRTPLGER